MKRQIRELELPQGLVHCPLKPKRLERGGIRMDLSNKSVWAILGIPVLVIVAMMVSQPNTDRAKFDKLQVGMTVEEVQAIVQPKTGKYRR